MFNIGPLEFMVLAIVGLLVVGPDKLPAMAKDAARMIRTLRDLATGARTQLRDELGPEFADVDLRNLNPRTMIQKAVLGEDFDLSGLNPRTAIQRAVLGDEDLSSLNPSTALKKAMSADPTPSPVSMDKPASGTPVSTDKPAARPYDSDAT